MPNNRIISLDVIRIIACVMIIAMHSPIPNTNFSSIVLSSDSLLTASGIGLFIMVSGALLLPVKMSTKDFLKKRLSKVVWPTVLWTLIYFAVAPWTDTVHRGDGLLSFLSIPFSRQFNGVLWFMYMLIGLYLLAPILSAWLLKVGKREVEFYLGVWAVTMCYPLIRNFISVNESNTGILYYFGGYAGYFLLGYYLRQYADESPLWLTLLLFIIPIGSAVALKIARIVVDFYDVFWYLSILIAMMSVGWFLLVGRLCPKSLSDSKFVHAIVTISNCCFGVYLSHILIMRSLLWHWTLLQNMRGAGQIILTTLLTFIGGLLLTWLLSWVPGSQYLIGFTKRKNK